VAWNGVFSWQRATPLSGAHVEIHVDNATAEVTGVEIVSPLVDAELTVVVDEAFRAADRHTEGARDALVKRALDDAKGDVGIPGRLTGKATRFANEAMHVVPREHFTGSAGALAVTVDGLLAFVACRVDDATRAGRTHAELLGDAVLARADAMRLALSRWRDVGHGALEQAPALPSSGAAVDGA